MANVDRPNGFIPVKTFSGAPVSSTIRAYGVADGADIFINQLVTLSSGLAAPTATNDAAILGSVVGIGKYVNGVATSGIDPDNVNRRYYDDSASTHTDYYVLVAPADDCIYEAQTATALTLVPGDTADISAGAGSTTTGISAYEITTSSNADLTVVEVPQLIDNTSTLVNGRYYVMITRAEQAFHA